MVKVLQLQISKKKKEIWTTFWISLILSYPYYFFYKLFLESLLLTWFWNDVDFCLQSIVHVRHFEMGDKRR